MGFNTGTQGVFLTITPGVPLIQEGNQFTPEIVSTIQEFVSINKIDKDISELTKYLIATIIGKHPKAFDRYELGKGEGEITTISEGTFVMTFWLTENGYKFQTNQLVNQ